MASVKGRNTGPELVVRRLLHAAGFRYRLHVASLPGRPDIVLPKWRTAIFVHGCFWHGHRCPKGRLPKSRQDFWGDKIARNRERDRCAQRAIRSRGFLLSGSANCGVSTTWLRTNPLLAFSRGRLNIPSWQ